MISAKINMNNIFQLSISETENESKATLGFTFLLTDHALQRMNERKIKETRLADTLIRGKIIRKQGVSFCVLKNAHLSDFKEKNKKISGNTIVLLNGAEDTIITTYYNTKGIKSILKKKRYKINS